MDKLPKSIQRMIDDTTKQCDDIIAAYASLQATHDANHSESVTLSLKDLEEMSMMTTRLRLLSMKCAIGHRDSSATAAHDANHSVTLKKMAQGIQIIHDFYAKEH